MCSGGTSANNPIPFLPQGHDGKNIARPAPRTTTPRFFETSPLYDNRRIHGAAVAMTRTWVTFPLRGPSSPALGPLPVLYSSRQLVPCRSTPVMTWHGVS